jgi:opacity protein-like surface antigen
MLLLTGTPAAAQETWELTFTPYLWLPSLTNQLHTRFGTLEAETSGSDTLSNLDLAFMAALEARYGRWSLVGDVLYVDLSAKQDTPLGQLFESVETETRGTAFSLYALYRAVETPRLALDLGGGARAYSLSFNTTLEPGALPGREFDLDESWVDPLLAGRVIATFDEHWSANAVLDVGGFDGQNDSTWQALASVNYAINDRWSLRAGWRYLDIQKEIGGLDIESQLNGPIVGVGIRF